MIDRPGWHAANDVHPERCDATVTRDDARGETEQAGGTIDRVRLRTARNEQYCGDDECMTSRHVLTT
jgi:hypothetical protein